MTPEAVALAKRLVLVCPDAADALEWTPRPVRHSVPDLDHPSNEGHLHALAEEVCGQPIGLHPDDDGGWLAVGKAGARHGVTRGQALAAAIVAAKEQA
jgi:hypothetical protein